MRSIVIWEVENFRKCGDPCNGFKFLVCEGCHDFEIEYRIDVRDGFVEWKKGYL
jgi:hypothetical protein